VRGARALAALAVASAVAGCHRVSVVPSVTPSADVVLVGAGDIAVCSDLSGAEATAKLLDAVPGIVFTLGDLAYPDGRPEDFANCYDPTWGRHKARTRPSLGNHDYHTAGAAGYFGYWGATAGDPDKGYYSYDAGTWHIVVINSNCDHVGGCQAGSPQEQWLRTDLEAHPTRCTLAYWHHPLFSSGVKPSHALHPEMRPIWRALYEAGAELIVNGHEHNYERFAPQDPDGAPDPARGIREIVAGVGGRSYDALVEPKPNSEIRSDRAFGVLKLTLRAGSYDWEFLPVAGQTFTDSGHGTCH
jgi:acid phosphatase type 7